MRCAAVTLAALALAPAAAAWTTVSGGVTNIVVPSMLVTRAGTELVSFESPAANTISVARNLAAPRVVVANDPVAGRTQLLQQPNGAIQLYFPNAQGVGRLTSTDDGQSWTGPVQTQSHTLGGVQGAAVGTYLAWPPGYPTAKELTVVPFRGGRPAADGFTFQASFSGGDPHMALAVDASDRLWAVWTGQGRLHAARSRSHDAHYGAQVGASIPATASRCGSPG